MYAPCLHGSTCLTVNSHCQDGQCNCRLGHFFKAGICGKSWQLNVTSHNRSWLTNISKIEANYASARISILHLIKMHINLRFSHTISSSIIVFVVPSIRLGDRCDLGDSCQDTQASCLQKVCHCKNQYQQIGDKCGKSMCSTVHAEHVSSCLFNSGWHKIKD